MTPFQLFNKQQWDTSTQTESPVTGKRIWDRIIRKLSLRRTRRIIAYSFAFASAAAACIAFGVFIGKNNIPDGLAPISTRTKWVACGPDAAVLPDGSKIWLGSGSTVSFSDNFSKDRRLALTGNATFEVVHEEDEAPFTVELGDMSFVEVHGTTFSVAQIPGEQISVSLYEGSVDFVSPQGHTSMNPGQTLTYLPAEESVSVETLATDANWQNGRFKIDDMPISKLVEFINWRYGVEVYVSPKLLQDNKKLTGSIGHDESVESVIDKICYVMGLSYRREGSGYRIYSTR